MILKDLLVTHQEQQKVLIVVFLEILFSMGEGKVIILGFCSLWEIEWLCFVLSTSINWKRPRRKRELKYHTNPTIVSICGAS